METIQEKCVEAAALLKVLSHPDRLKILCELVEGEKNVTQLIERVGLSQSATSQYLTRMKLEGLVSSRKESLLVFYKIADPKVEQLMSALHAIFCKK